MSKIFQKTIENFICGNCGTKIKGAGYTNHCPNCLYSKHMDVNPGDRQETCGGMMAPVDFEIAKGKYVLIHQCQKCGLRKKNLMQKNDKIDALVELSKTIAKKLKI